MEKTVGTRHDNFFLFVCFRICRSHDTHKTSHDVVHWLSSLGGIYSPLEPRIFLPNWKCVRMVLRTGEELDAFTLDLFMWEFLEV